jgi:dihydroorotase
MIPLDIAIQGAQVVTGQSMQSVTIGIRFGKIAGHYGPGEEVAAHEVIDAKGKVILPGIIDAHVHFREPGYAHKEGFETGSMAAAAGGVTTVMDMPNTDPPTFTPKAFEEKVRTAAGKIYVDLALQAGVGEDLSPIEPLAKMGAVSFELFLAEMPAPFLVKDNGVLWKMLERIATVGSLAGITPGDDGIVQARIADPEIKNSQDPIAFARSRPSIAEAFGIARACLAAKEVGARIHLRQTSTRLSTEVLRTARSQYGRITAEVTPHNLLLSEDELKKQGPFAKMIPPLRKNADMESLWQALQDGIIDIVDTDHAPHLPEEKEPGKTDICKGPGGIPGVQTLLPLMLEQVAQGRISFIDLARICSREPARIFGLYPKKGSLEVGADADLVIIDPKMEKMIENQDQLSKARITPFNGWKIHGWPILTMVRGMVVMRNGKIEGRPRGSLVTSPKS